LGSRQVEQATLVMNVSTRAQWQSRKSVSSAATFPKLGVRAWAWADGRGGEEFARQGVKLGVEVDVAGLREDVEEAGCGGLGVWESVRRGMAWW
jgi:hypothetical protein